MFTFIKTLDFWLIVVIVLSLSGGSYMLGYSRASDKAMDKIAKWKDEQSIAFQKAMEDEFDRQWAFIDEREPIIQKELHYLDRTITEYEQVISAHPDSCILSPDRVRAYNNIGKASTN